MRSTVACEAGIPNYDAFQALLLNKKDVLKFSFELEGTTYTCGDPNAPANPRTAKALVAPAERARIKAAHAAAGDTVNGGLNFIDGRQKISDQHDAGVARQRNEGRNVLRRRSPFLDYDR